MLFSRTNLHHEHQCVVVYTHTYTHTHMHTHDRAYTYTHVQSPIGWQQDLRSWEGVLTNQSVPETLE